MADDPPEHPADTATLEPRDDAGDSDRAGDGTDDGDRSETTGRRRRLSWWAEGLLVLALAVVLAVLLKSFVAQAFYIPSESMQPGLVADDRIVVEKPTLWFGGPDRGDVVVFEDPGGWLAEGEADDSADSGLPAVLAAIGLYPRGDHLVKRVIGVAGDTIVCCDDRGRISVNGQPLDEKGYATRKGAKCFGPMSGTCDWTAGPVPEGTIFVMGDNRFHSADSTVQMCTDVETDCVPGREFVPTDLVVGKVAAVIWPLGHLRLLSRPDALADVPDPR